jgi:fructose-bisphosphate aldolase class II
MKEILEHAVKGNYAVAAPNVGNSIEVNAAIAAAEELNAPLILDVHFENLRSKMPGPRPMGAFMRARAEEASVPVAINQDHGNFHGAVRNIQCGVTSVMCDSSMLPYEENIAAVKKTAEIAHMAYDVSIEAELGHVGHTVDTSEQTQAGLTDPDQVLHFIQETGIDALAIAIGTAHGLYPKGVEPNLDFERLATIKKLVGDFPLVLHGSSGTPNDQIYKACRMGINKVNIASDLGKSAWDAVLAANGQGPLAVVYTEGFKSKLVEMIPIYGSDGKAWKR